MKLIDVTVPLDGDLPVYPGQTPFVLEQFKKPGAPLVDADGAPARVVRRRN